MAQLGKLLGFPENRRTYEESPRLALNKCNTGVEFEFENVKLGLPIEEPAAGFWVAKPDGSLRGNGMEFVLREPLFGEDLYTAVKWLCEWAAKNNFECNYRTGLHVHIDVRNMDEDELISMLVYYALYEKVIFDWVGDDREGSNFCMPFYIAELVLEDIVRALRANDQMREMAKKIDRYAGLNVNPLSKFGSVEWRHLQTTTDFERVLTWINICQSFKKYARKNALKPTELLAELSSKSPEGLFLAILGPTLKEKLWKPGSAATVWERGIPVAQEIATLLDNRVGANWNAIRTTIGAGTNSRWLKWVEKMKKDPNINKVPDNPFHDPNAFLDKTVQKEAIQQLADAIRAKLEEVVIQI
jgi:hypothetical protein